MEKKKKIVRNIKENKSLFEFIKFSSMSILTSLVEISLFSLLNYLVFISLSSIDFNFWFFDYSISNGGLSAFLAFNISYVVAQVFNFIVQRKVTFKANNNVFKSAIMYVIMILVIFILQMYIPTLIYIPISNVFGLDWAGFIIKNMMMFLAFLIQFPINKFIIMKNNKQ